jgi:hypothetical protein
VDVFDSVANAVAGLLFYIATGAAVLTFLAWLLFVSDADAAITRTVTVLVISCPHALGLAIPLVIALATSLSARQGILVRDRLSLERMRDVDMVLNVVIEVVGPRLLGPALMVAAAIVVKGYGDVGDGFSAGSAPNAASGRCRSYAAPRRSRLWAC